MSPSIKKEKNMIANLPEIKRKEEHNNFHILMEDNKMKIKWNSKITGIYVWINKINNKMYVGRSTNLYKRIYTEKNDFSNDRHNGLVKLYNAVKKYGIQHFVVKLISECNKEKLNYLEKIWIGKLNSKENGYNCTYGGEGSRGHKTTPNQIEKQKTNLKLYWTDERKKIHSEKMKNWYNTKTDEEKERIKDCGRLWKENKDLIEKQRINYIKSLTKEKTEKQKKSLLEYYKVNESKKLMKFELISPNNEVISVNGLVDFCKKYKIGYKKAKSLYLGKIKEYKGWKLK